MKLTESEKETIRKSAAMIYAAAENEEMYNKETFMSHLRKTVANTPVRDHAEASEVLSSFNRH